MEIFLICQLGKAPAPLQWTATIKRFRALTARFFSTAPSIMSRTGNGWAMVRASLDTRKFKCVTSDEDETTWAYAPQYPMNARRLVQGLGRGPDLAQILPTICRAFQSESVRTTESLEPPFSLIWEDKKSGELFVQNDVLGHAQLFEYNGHGTRALSNRIFTFKSLDLPLTPVASEWATRSIIGWFPLHLTGFSEVTYTPPATQYRFAPVGLKKITHDVLAHWVHPPQLSEHDCYDLAWDATVELSRSGLASLRKPHFSLSGGWDSRAILSVLASIGAQVSARVHGPAGHEDVKIAGELAQRVGWELAVSHQSGQPPSDPVSARSSIIRALQWQAGTRNAHKHKTFQVRGPFANGGSVEISGQHGEIGRSHYEKLSQEAHVPADGSSDSLFALLTGKAPPFLRPKVRDDAVELIRQATRSAEKYHLTGHRSWDFFYLYERTRRWASSSHASKPGLNFAPFLNSGYVKAVFAHPDPSRIDNPFHRNFIRRYDPRWVEIAFAGTQPLPPMANRCGEESGRAGVVEQNESWKLDGRYYSSRDYWLTTGKNLMEEVLRSEGFWTEVFDPILCQEQWMAAPDDLVITAFLSEALLEPNPVIE